MISLLTLFAIIVWAFIAGVAIWALAERYPRISGFVALIAFLIAAQVFL